jgi:hypothetical protein
VQQQNPYASSPRLEDVADVEQYCFIRKKPYTVSHWVTIDHNKYYASKKAFERLIDSDQPEDDKHTNFLKAAYLLLIAVDNSWWLKTKVLPDEHDNITINFGRLKGMFKDTLLMFYASDVLERVELKQNGIPNKKYHSYMKLHEEEAEKGSKP